MCKNILPQKNYIPCLYLPYVYIVLSSWLFQCMNKNIRFFIPHPCAPSIENFYVDGVEIRLDVLLHHLAGVYENEFFALWVLDEEPHEGGEIVVLCHGFNGAVVEELRDVAFIHFSNEAVFIACFLTWA